MAMTAAEKKTWLDKMKAGKAKKKTASGRPDPQDDANPVTESAAVPADIKKKHWTEEWLP